MPISYALMLRGLILNTLKEAVGIASIDSVFYRALPEQGVIYMIAFRQVDFTHE